MRVHGYATGTNGTKVKSTIYFPDDPGYYDTARMLVESGLCFIFNKKEMNKISGGYHTTASC